MLSPVLNNPWVRAAGVLVCLVLLLILLYLLSPVLVPLGFAFLVAYVFDPVIDSFEARGMPRIAGILVVIFGIVIALVSLPLIVLPRVVLEAEDLIRSARQDLDDEWLDTTIEWLPLEEAVVLLGWVPGEESVPLTVLREDGEGVDVEPTVTPGDPEAEAAAEILEEQLDDAAPDADTDAEAAADAEGEPPQDAMALETDDELSTEERAEEAEEEAAEAAEEETRVDVRAVLAERIGEGIQRNATDFLRSNAAGLATFGSRAGSSAADFFRGVGNWLLGSALFLGNFVLFVFVTIYLLKDYDRIIAQIDDLLPPRYRPYVRSTMHRIDLQLRAFLRGQFLVCCSLGIMYAIGLEIAGTPFALALAIFGGVASFVPYLGLALAIGPAVLLTLIEHGFDWHVLAVFATFAIAQAIEGNLLTPRIVGSQVGLGPVWVILAVLVFGSALGFLGLLLAVPFAAALKVIVLDLVAYYRRSSWFVGEDAPPPPSPPG